MAKNLKQIMKNLGLDLTQNLFLKLSLDEINKYKSDNYNPEFNEEKTTSGTNKIYTQAAMLPDTKSQVESSLRTCG